MAKNKKHASWKNDPGRLAKEAKGTERADQANEEFFRWRAAWADLEGTWGFHHATCEQIWQEILPRLHDFESMKWNEIFGPRVGSNHPMPVDKIERDAQRRLQDIGRGDWDTLFQLNVRGGIRLWGIRDRAYFYLLWFDPNHTVYVQRD